MKREMEAYIVLLHQGWATFTDIRDLVGWDVWKQSEAQRIVAHINNRLLSCPEYGEEPHRDVFSKKIATYENWDKVLEVFREEAFHGRTEEDEG